MTVVDTTPPPVARGLHRTLWALQGVLGVFLIVASAGPKLFGEANAVQTFEDMGAAPWFRYLVGLLELAGGIGLLVPRLAGLAAVGLALLMVGAAITQAFILDGGALVLTPVVLFALFVFIAWGRRHSIRRLLKR
ncbi:MULTISPECIES: DoxX family protein [Micromonospora]|uniref:DoxX family protein n=1 Tax=Micromonospora tulbaghiae TaxID=479978 RepID=A0A386WMA2_9ACTN|nr:MULTISPECIES: DoxX family protein [Micromonospora]AYF28778.1 DoxX family protein [Micromonospora tulbaghiae]MCO1616144.1 DoxX family protein [Micromonospora sp. CPM1]NED54073.1 DoxX family protein [Micromonospora aurantiaca]